MGEVPLALVEKSQVTCFSIYPKQFPDGCQIIHERKMKLFLLFRFCLLIRQNFKLNNFIDCYSFMAAVGVGLITHNTELKYRQTTYFDNPLREKSW